MGTPVDLLMTEVTAPQLQLYKSVALVDGPWWCGAAEAVYSADVCHAIVASQAGKDCPPWASFHRTWDTETQAKPALTGKEVASFMSSLVPPNKRPPA